MFDIYMKLRFNMLVVFRKLHIGLKKKNAIKNCKDSILFVASLRQSADNILSSRATLWLLWLHRSDTMRTIMHRIYGTFYHIEVHKQIDI